MVSIAVAVRVSPLPIWWYGNLGPVVLALAVELFVALPRYIRGVLHHISAVVRVTAFNVQEDRGIECIIEDGVWRETARVVGFLDTIFSHSCQRRAVTVVDVASGDGCSRELGGVEGLRVSPVVLVEVCEAVVEEDWGCHVCWNREGDGAARSRDGS